MKDGVRILWVSNLGRDAVCLFEHSILIVDASFSMEAAEEMVDQGPAG